MSRLVTAKKRDESTYAGARQTNTGVKDRLERVAKYIPSEILAAYMFFNNIIVIEPDHVWRLAYFSLAFFFCLIMTPLYLGKMAEPGDPKLYQQVVSTLAFVLWAYALGVGFFVEWGVYVPILAAILIGMFSVVSAYLVPSAP